jgi:hypothetical protein
MVAEGMGVKRSVWVGCLRGFRQAPGHQPWLVVVLYLEALLRTVILVVHCCRVSDLPCDLLFELVSKLVATERAR